MFAQPHVPGEAAHSDFTHMQSQSVTLGGVPFVRLVFHLVRVYSNVDAEGRVRVRARYRLVLAHYGLEGTTNNVGVAHEKACASNCSSSIGLRLKA